MTETPTDHLRRAHLIRRATFTFFVASSLTAMSLFALGLPPTHIVIGWGATMLALFLGHLDGYVTFYLVNVRPQMEADIAAAVRPKPEDDQHG